ncbi:tyrosine-type recombinase/integrase [Streptomyces sp. TRM68367]|uniref:tyrosine-type recombinase/integrase n=1 Tax=Streptomyces sp. TRM68367 TaxID=2758415 RepID=UPI00165A2D37|nr:tyrosine-type recombinase/integrase [Streptomyces sp. TRM68367]MBC9725059.1 tyrosine-type recombinase/integrase [Streptomyces sp. TRM68367]
MFEDKTYKRCACKGPLTDKVGKPILNEDGTPKIGYLEKRCPKLKRRDHGSWYYSIEIPAGPGGKRRHPKKGGFQTQKQAAAAAEKVYRDAQAGVDVLSDETVGEYLRRWLDNQHDLKATTKKSYEDYLRLYFTPYLGHIKLRELRPRHIEEMFAAIQAENKVKEKNQAAAQLAREAEKKAHAAWRDATAPRDPQLRETWNEARAHLKAALARPRRQTGPATQHRIKMALSSAVEDARKRRMVTDNWASMIQTPRVRKAKALEWTAARVEAWRKTGKKPSPVMVWTPEQTGKFLDSVVYDRLYPLWVIIAFLGLRRGEACALSWAEVDLDAGVIHITEEIVTVAYEPHEDTPKSDNIRDISLDEDTIALLRWWRGRQEAEKQEWLESTGEWTNSGRVFTLEDGTEYHPQYFSDRFERLYKKVDLPPIRLHDLRHGSATLALRAGVAMVTVQRRLGHSSIRVTSDIYTTVLAEVEREAAEATVSVVPRSRKRVIPQPQTEGEAAADDEQQDDPETAEEAPDVPTEDAA